MENTPTKPQGSPNVRKRLKKNIKGRIIDNIKDYKLWAVFLVTVTLYVLRYTLLYDVQDSDTIFLELVMDIGVGVFNFLFFIIFREKNTVATYLIFLIIGKSLTMIFAISAHDLDASVSNKIAMVSSTSTMLMIYSKLINIGISFMNLLIIPYILLSSLLNLIDFEAIKYMKKTWIRIFWFVLFTTAETAMFFAIFSLINNYYFSLAQSIYNSETNSIKLIAENGSLPEEIAKAKAQLAYMQIMFTAIKPILSFIWFPLIMAINAIRKTDIFAGKNVQIYIAAQIVMLISYLLVLSDVKNKDLYIPIIMLVYIGTKLAWFAFLFFITIYRNAVLSNAHNIVYVPFAVALNKRPNGEVQAMAYISKRYRPRQ